MKFVYVDKTEFEADIITDILGSENINFKTKVNYKHLPMFLGIAQLELFDIKFNTDYQKYLFVDKLIQDKLNKYKKLEKCFKLPDYDKYKIIEPENELEKALNELRQARKELKKDIETILKNEQNQSLLYKFAKWIKERKWLL